MAPPTGFANFTGGITLEIWANPTAVTSGAPFFDLGRKQGTENIVLQRNGTTNDLRLEVWRGGTSVALTAPGAIALNGWQHFVATIDPSGTARLYKNGVQIASLTNPAFMPNNIARNSNFVGRDNRGNSYQGSLDEAAIYGTALSPARIRVHYSAGTGP